MTDKTTIEPTDADFLRMGLLMKARKESALLGADARGFAYGMLSAMAAAMATGDQHARDYNRREVLDCIELGRLSHEAAGERE